MSRFQRGHPHLNETPADRSRFPHPRHAIIGRELLLARCQRRLASGRPGPLSLVGPGGIGKTRLALELAACSANDGIPAWFVALDQVPPGGDIDTAIRMALPGEHRASAGPCEWLRTEMGQVGGLLVLDNAEHLLEAVRTTVEDFTARLPQLRLLVTSRSALGVPGEQAIAVPSLELPLPNCPPSEAVNAPAIAYYIQRMRPAGPTWQPDASEIRHITEICVLLEGLPLGIELAASHSRQRGAAATARSLEAGLATFRGMGRRAKHRHSTLEAVVRWSLDLLPAALRVAYPRLAVLEPGWLEQDAVAVCHPHLEPGDVVRFAEASLLRVVPADEGPRYSLAPALRRVAAETAASSDREESAALHGRWFLAPTRSAADRPGLVSDAANIVAAMAWGADHLPAEAARCGARLGGFWTTTAWGYRAAPVLEKLLADEASVPPVERGTIGLLLIALADMADDIPAAEARASLVLQIARTHGMRAMQGAALMNLGLMRSRGGDDQGALVPCRQGVEALRAAGHREGLAQALSSLAGVYRVLGDLDATASALEGCLVCHQQLDDPVGLATVLHNQADLLTLRGLWLRAEGLFERSLAIRLEVGDELRVDQSLAGIAGLALARGQCERTLTLHAAADALRRQLGVVPEEGARREYARDVARATQLLPAEAARACAIRGEAMGPAEAAAYASESRGDPRHPACALPVTEAQLRLLRHADRTGDCSDKGLAVATGLHPCTIKAHWRDMMRSLGLHTRRSVLERARDAGWMGETEPIRGR